MGYDRVRFHEHEKERTPLLEKIAAEKAKLEEEKRLLSIEEEAVQDQQSAASHLQQEIEKAEGLLKIERPKSSGTRQLENERNAGRAKGKLN